MDEPNTTAYDEMVSGRNSIRSHWRNIVALMSELPPETLRERQARAANHLSAADQILPEQDDSKRPIWTLDLLPLILPESEWLVISDGLAQRARLLNMILADIYGAQLLLKENLLPPYLIFNNPGFLRPLRFVTALHAPPLHFYAADLARMPDGQWRVLADRTQAPGGVGYALRHRSVLARSMPELFRSSPVQRLQPTLDLWCARLQSIGASFDESPQIVLLTPGPHNPSYPEHVLLAYELGIVLVQGSDLTVREGMVYLKTLSGLARVHVIYRRVDSEYCDPLELRADSALGVGGLIAAARAGNVAILNLPGSSVIETPAFAPFLPAISRRLLNEELRLPAVTTWWCGQAMPLAEALKSPESFVFQPAFRSDSIPIDPYVMDSDSKKRFLDKLKSSPSEFVAVERVTHSRAPIIGNNGFEPRAVVLRAVAISAGDSWAVLPGGVARNPEPTDQRPAFVRGGMVKDVWVFQEEFSANASQSEELIELRKLQRVAETVGSRVADDLFWFGRYLERIDSGLRQLRTVSSRLVRGNLGPRDRVELALAAHLLFVNEWLVGDGARAPVDSSAFAASVVSAAGPRGMLGHYYGLVRQLGVSLRDRFSQDMWRLVRDIGLRAPSFGRTDLDTVLGILDNGILTIATLGGLVAENMTRGMGWRFMEMGRRIERAISICTYIENLFAGRPDRIEVSVRLLLELCDSVMTHRRRFPTDHYSLPTVEVVLSDEFNPRSLAYQLTAIDVEFDGLIGEDPLAMEREIIQRQLSLLRSPAPYAEINSDDRLSALEIGAQRCRADLYTVSDTLSRTFLSHTNDALTIIHGVAGRGVDQAAS